MIFVGKDIQWKIKKNFQGFIFLWQEAQNEQFRLGRKTGLAQKTRPPGLTRVKPVLNPGRAKFSFAQKWAKPG